MEDLKATGDHASKTVKKAKKVTITITFGLVTKIVAVVLILGLLFGVYMLGVKSGKNDKTSNSPASRLADTARSSNKRWSQIGEVTEVNDKKVKIKDSRDEEEAILNDETSVTGSDGKKTDIKAIKKGQRVVATGTKDDKGVQTATRVRIQK